MTNERPLPENAALARMRSGGLALGMLLRFSRSGEIARIARATGHDFIFIDGQHALYSLDTINELVLAALGCGIAPFVRTRGYADADAGRLLDAGVAGIVVPDVNNADEARAAVNACKFAPVGRRSVAGAYASFNYQPQKGDEASRLLNDATAVVCMIESREGLRNVREIAKVEGVDVLHIGCSDLLSEMGKPGQYGCPEIVDAINRVIAACADAGKFAGLGGDKDVQRQKHFIESGIRFVTTQSDIAFLMAEASRRVAELRG